MSDRYFTCPSCGSHYFGRDVSSDLVVLPTVRCHGDCNWRGVWPPKAPAKRYYVLMERLGKGPSINGYDIWLTTWEQFANELIAPLEELEAGVPWDCRFTVLEMTDEEYEAYCEEHEIERGCE